MLNNATWKIEQVITRMRIQAAQGIYLLTQGFSIWGASVIALLWIGLMMATPEQKHNVVPWLKSSVWAAVKPTKTIIWQGKPYDARVLADWMDENIYAGTLWQWLFWAAYWGVAPLSVIGSVGLWWVRRPEEKERHIRGAVILEKKELQNRLSAMGTGGLVVAGIQLPEELECHHVAICGATGAGKSNALRQILQQIERRGGPCIVVDPHGEATSQFYNPERGDNILNPLDARCPTWIPQLEGESEEEIAALAAASFRVVPGSTGPASYYATVARRGYRKLMDMADGRPVHEIPDLLTELVQSKRLRLDRPEVMSTMQNGLDPWRYLRPGTREWSAKNWVANPEGWCFLTFRDKEKAAVLPIVSLWFAALVSQLLSRDAAGAVTIPLVIDELAALEHQPALDDLLSQIRKRRVSVFLGFQDVQQLYPLYGEHLTHSMLNQPATHLYFRSNSSETQAWCAANIGEQEVMTLRESETVGPENVRDSLTRSSTERTKPTVMATEFGQLYDLQAYLRVGPFGITKVQTQYAPGEVKHPAFIARASDQMGNEGKASECRKAGKEKLVVNPERRAL